MQSKLLVNVQENGSPCITVIQPNVKPGQDFILADRVLQMFFEKMNPDIRFCGVVPEDTSMDNSVKSIIPMDIPQVLEWLNRFFFENKCKDAFQKERVQMLFDQLREIYYNNPELENVFINGEPLTEEAKKSALEK